MANIVDVEESECLGCLVNEEDKVECGDCEFVVPQKRFKRPPWAEVHQKRFLQSGLIAKVEFCNMGTIFVAELRQYLLLMLNLTAIAAILRDLFDHQLADHFFFHSFELIIGFPSRCTVNINNLYIPTPNFAKASLSYQLPLYALLVYNVNLIINLWFLQLVSHFGRWYFQVVDEIGDLVLREVAVYRVTHSVLTV